MMSEATRGIIYRIATVLLPVLVALGYVTDEVAASILAAVAAFLVPALASANTTVKRKTAPQQ